MSLQKHAGADVIVVDIGVDFDWGLVPRFSGEAKRSRKWDCPLTVQLSFKKGNNGNKNM